MTVTGDARGRVVRPCRFRALRASPQRIKTLEIYGKNG